MDTLAEERFGVNRTCAAQASRSLQRRNFATVEKTEDGSYAATITATGRDALVGIRPLLTADHWRAQKGTSSDHGKIFGGKRPPKGAAEAAA